MCPECGKDTEIEEFIIGNYEEEILVSWCEHCGWNKEALEEFCED